MCKYDHLTPPPISLPSINLKLEILDGDDFSIDNLSSSKVHLQDFPDLEQIPLTVSSCNPDIGMQANSFDPFDPFSHGSSSIDFGFYTFKPFEENGCISTASMQGFQGGGFLNLSDRQDSLVEIKTDLKYHDLIKPLSSVIIPDEGSCVTADNLGCLKEDGCKRSKNSIQRNNSNGSGFMSTKKAGRGREKSTSSKGQWTIEEDR